MRFTYLHHRRENKHMEKFSQLVTWVDGKVWGWGMILLLLGTHLFMTVRTGFIQRKTITKGIKLSVSKEPDADGEVSQFGALATALASTIGTGNIIGVGTLIWVVIASVEDSFEFWLHNLLLSVCVRTS